MKKEADIWEPFTRNIVAGLDDSDLNGGVREPRRPLPSLDSGAVALALPEADLTEDMMDSERWPTAGLSDRQIELLTIRLERHNQNRLRKLLGKLGLQ